MSENQPAVSIDMIRWTFTIDMEKRAQVETYLSDLGAEVLVPRRPDRGPLG